MATIKSTAEFIMRRVAGGDVVKDLQLDIREVEFMIFNELNSLLKIQYYENIKIEDEHGVNPLFIFSYKTIIQTDTDRNEKYVNIPYSYVNMPNGKGIQEIRSAKNAAHSFIPIPANSWSLLSAIPAGNLEKQTGFYPERNRAYLVNCNINTAVIVKLVVASGDDLIMDAGLEADVIKNVLALFLNKQPQDRINNENDKAQ